LNPRPRAYESPALPLSYSGGTVYFAEYCVFGLTSNFDYVLHSAPLAVQREANAMKTAPQEKESRQNHPANIIAVLNSRNRKLRALWIRGRVF
jgi:hypothetical protein